MGREFWGGKGVLRRFKESRTEHQRHGQHYCCPNGFCSQRDTDLFQPILVVSDEVLVVQPRSLQLLDLLSLFVRPHVDAFHSESVTAGSLSAIISVSSCETTLTLTRTEAPCRRSLRQLRR